MGKSVVGNRFLYYRRVFARDEREFIGHRVIFSTVAAKKCESLKIIRISTLTLD